MIFANSRYSGQQVQPLVLGGVVRRTVMRRPPWRASPQADHYVWKNTDRIDQLAAQYYGDPALWWKLADLNPDVLDLRALTAGDVIKVPHVV